MRKNMYQEMGCTSYNSSYYNNDHCIHRYAPKIEKKTIASTGEEKLAKQMKTVLANGATLT